MFIDIDFVLLFVAVLLFLVLLILDYGLERVVVLVLSFPVMYVFVWFVWSLLEMTAGGR